MERRKTKKSRGEEMKLLLNNKYEEVGFWSFMKCTLLVQLALTGLIYAGFFILGMILVFGGWA